MRNFYKSFFALLLAILPVTQVNAQSALAITNISDNKAQYTGSQIPNFEMYELTFLVQNSNATNRFYPYTAQAPPGLPNGTGISVDAQFLPPGQTDWNNAFSQPAFYNQEFEYRQIANKEWMYPTNVFNWKVRFSPNTAGTWQYRIVARDGGGSATTSPQTFTVVTSGSKGFIKRSSDARYFEYDDGTYFPALGYNLNGGDLDNVNPVLGNQSKFQVMKANGIELTRVWISQFSIYGEAWGKWSSPNRVHQTQEMRLGIVNHLNTQLDRYPVLTSLRAILRDSPPQDSQYFMWLNFDEQTEANGEQLYFTPCRVIAPIAVKQNMNYRVRVRFISTSIEGPRVAGQPWGFAVKRSTGEMGFPTGLCNEPNQGTVVAASYISNNVHDDPDNPGWKILEGSFNSGATDFLPYFYLTFNNAKSTDADTQAGHVFIDRVWLEEASCPVNGTCANLIHKPWMSMLDYINQRDAFSFDKLLNLSRANNIYLKAVMLEKNDRIAQSIDYNGQITASPNIEYFYGNGTTVTKVRWLQQAWWRYMQARWGYSPNIHSWELLNEGGANTNHLIQADEFGKYMHCRAFGKEPVLDPTLGNMCKFDHPNSHLVTTSFYGSMYPWQFWNNGGNAAGYKLYRDIDYADQHHYANVEDTSALAGYYDSALYSYNLSTANNFSPTTRKPLMRGETAWNPPAGTYFETNVGNGEWLHDFIWAGINHGGLMEHFFGGGRFTRQIFNLSANPPYDHRPMFGTYYRYIKDIPLNNGNYQDAAATVSQSNLRAWGQKDVVNHRAHLWIANKQHTWYNAMGGYSGGPAPVAITAQSGTVTLSGFSPNRDVRVEWWDTYQGVPTTSSTMRTDASGNLVLTVSNITSDTAVKIGEYTTGITPTPTSGASTPTPTPTPGPVSGDANGDRQVNEADYQIWQDHYLQSVSGAANGDFDGNGRVDGVDYVIWLTNYNS